MDNLAAIEAEGGELADLPASSPDLDPIAQVFAEPKALLRREGVRRVTTSAKPSAAASTPSRRPRAPMTSPTRAMFHVNGKRLRAAETGAAAHASSGPTSLSRAFVAGIGAPQSKITLGSQVARAGNAATRARPTSWMTTKGAMPR